MTFSVNTVVSARTRKGPIDCVITGVRYIKRGRWANRFEYTLAPMVRTGKVYAHKFVGEDLLGKPKGTYTPEEIAAAKGEKNATTDRIETAKYERAEAGREVLKGVTPGDRVKIKYSDIERWEDVVKVNTNTGKVGIQKRHSSKLRWLPATSVIDIEKDVREL